MSTTEYLTFDILGRVTRSKQTTDGVEYGGGSDPTKWMTYAYNLSGALVEQQYPSGRVVKNTFDAADGSLSIVRSKRNANYGFFKYASALSYNAAGAVTSMQLGNARWESTVFNSRLQPTQIALGTTENTTDLLDLDYSYGTTANNGNVQSQTITIPGVTLPFVQHYTYDSLNRLQSADEKPSGWTPTNCTSDPTKCWKQTFKYDRYGNRNFDTTTGATTTLPPSFDPNIYNPTVSTTDNRFTSGQGYSYDSAGNTTRDAESRKFTYDAENKQTKVETLDGSNNPIATVGEYVYDGDGKRVKKVVPGGETTVFVYDAGGKLIGEYSTEVQPSQDAKTQYLTADHLGTPRINTNSVGAVVSRSDYMPYGEEITGGRSSGHGYVTDDVRQGFTGYENDDETGLDYAQARMYAKGLGRFTGVDPIYIQASMIGDPQRFNLYVYVRNNPNKFVDTDGERLRLSGDLTFLRNMIDQWGDKFKDKISVAEDGTVSFNVTADDIKGNEAAQYLFDLVNDQETILFFAGTDANAAGAFVDENKDSGGNSRETLMKQFSGEAYAAGGGYFVATRGRVLDKGGAATGTPIDGLFAVVAFNTDAKFFEIQGKSDTDPTRDKKDPADLSIATSSFYIHEGAENLDFARQKRAGTALNSTAYATAHSAAKSREDKIREQLKITGGKAGGSIRTSAPKNKKN